MRHNKKFNHLGRKSAHRKAMLANMASSLIAHKRITTTVAKARALRMYVEPLITKAKNDTTHSRRVVFSYLQDKHAVSELFRDVAAKVADRPGGYTRILKTGNRLGDNAEMCIIELVDYNEAMLAAKEEAAKPKKRRSRRGGGKKADDTATAPVAETTAPAADAEEDKAEVEEVKTEATEPVEEAKAEESEVTAEAEFAEEEVAEEPKAEADTEEQASEEGDAEEDKKKEE
jgi:large subunit ribosomal protein L17